MVFVLIEPVCVYQISQMRLIGIKVLDVAFCTEILCFNVFYQTVDSMNKAYHKRSYCLLRLLE